MNNKISGRKFLTGMISGAFAGSVIALLFAPKSGRRLRRDIAIKKNKILNDTDTFLRKAKNYAADTLEEGKRKAERIMQDSKRKLNL